MKIVLALVLTVGLFGATETIGDPIGTNFPKDGEGRVYHLGVKKGEVANRIVLVGDPDRAKLMVSLLDDPEHVFVRASNRGFTTYTGSKHGVPVTIMAIGMGLPMMDFAVREIRAVTDGDLFMIRLGSCGTPREDIQVGSVVVAKDSFCATTKYDRKKGRSFRMTSPILADSDLHERLMRELVLDGRFPVVEATDATTDFFYSTQGRLDDQFDDQNENWIDTMMERYPEVGSLQMETYQLFYLGKLNPSIHTAGCSIVFAERKSGKFITNDYKHIIEVAAGNACLEALVNAPMVNRHTYKLSKEEKAQVDSTLAAFSTMQAKEVVYVSSPITSGKRLYNYMDACGFSTIEEAKKDKNAFYKNVMGPNMAESERIVAELKETLDGVVISPIAFERGLSWGQDTFMAMWLTLIEEKVTRIVFIDGWQYSNGAVEEFLQATNKGIDIVDSQGNPISHEEGLDLISLALMDIEARSLKAPVLARVLSALR